MSQTRWLTAARSRKSAVIVAVAVSAACRCPTPQKSPSSGCSRRVVDGPVMESGRVIRVVGLLAVCGAAAVVVDVFSMGEGGYFCIKIPYLIALQNGDLIAFAEARIDSCSDYAGTDLVSTSVLFLHIDGLFLFT